MLKILKQELLFIPLMLLLVEFARHLISGFYPETALFDRGSELETFIFRVWQITWITSAVWLLMRVVFPPGYKSLREFYHKYDTFNPEYREKTALKIALVFFLGLVYLIGKGQTQHELRFKLTDTLKSQLYVREATGHNDGKEVESYLAFVGRPKGDAWCAAYVSSNLNFIGIGKPINPVNAWAPVFANKYIIKTEAQPGDVFTIYSSSAGRVCHVGFIIATKGQYYITNEGNTSITGTSEGGGVHSLKRPKIKIYKVADYITAYLKYHEKNTTALNLNTALLLSPEGVFDFQSYREIGQYEFAKGFDLVPGFAFKNKGFKSNYHSFGSTRSERPYKPSGDSSGKRAIKGQCFNYRWKAAGELCLQRPGIKGKAPKPVNTATNSQAKDFTNRKNYLQDKGSKIYTERC